MALHRAQRFAVAFKRVFCIVASKFQMNQQRSRRFRASKEAADKEQDIKNVRAALESEGIPLPPPKPKDEHFDSNCITPGTPFMARLAVALRYYIHLRITNDPAWFNIQASFLFAFLKSSKYAICRSFCLMRTRQAKASIKSWITYASNARRHHTIQTRCIACAVRTQISLCSAWRHTRSTSTFCVRNSCRISHVLANSAFNLVTSSNIAKASPITTTIRTSRRPPQSRKASFFCACRFCANTSSAISKCLSCPSRTIWSARSTIGFSCKRRARSTRLMIGALNFRCFFVGNDFLPHLPSLEIRENAIDRLIKLYKDVVYSTKGLCGTLFFVVLFAHCCGICRWLTENGHVFVDRVELIMKELGRVEDKIFRDRQDRELRFRENQKRRRRQENRTQKPAFLPQSSSFIAPYAPGSAPNAVSGAEARRQMADQRRVGMEPIGVNRAAWRCSANFLRPPF